MELSQYVTYVQYLELNSNEVLICDVEQGTPPDTKSPRVFSLCYFQYKRRLCEVIISFWCR